MADRSKSSSNGTATTPSPSPTPYSDKVSPPSPAPAGEESPSPPSPGADMNPTPAPSQESSPPKKNGASSMVSGVFGTIVADSLFVGYNFTSISYRFTLILSSSKGSAYQLVLAL
ncbi:early nodulin-like protein 3 [Phtheirospermum japonicum]|uniref:Early nodulin-like protein 3 n=1 Tax=Phtheirospermum japonicum TaxID=374723 RepID=A0A830C1I6_9LAMI|nr:early nodulin-like protein 3 [Phtheirospermum japonicum]